MINLTENIQKINSNHASSVYQVLTKDIAEQVGQSGEMLDLAAYNNTDFFVRMPESASFQNIGIQIDFDNAPASTIDVFYSLDGSAAGVAVATVNVSAGASSNYINITNFTGRFVILNFKGINTGNLIFLGILGKK